MKRRITSLLLVAMMILTAFAGTFTIGAETPVITMLDGAAIRCAEPSGIRFISQISTANKEAATEIGTYIFPYAEYKASGAATPQAYFATNDAKFVKIVAEDGIHTDGDVTYIYAALVNIKSTNYGRDFAAVSYAIIGEETCYSAFDESKNVRNIREVAVSAYNDFATEEGTINGPYNYKYEIAEGKWSCYSETQREVIASYDNAIFRLMNDGTNVWNGANDKYNDPVLPELDSKWKHSITGNEISINPLPTITDGALDFTYDGYCGYYRTRFDNYTTAGELTDLAKDLRNGFTLEVSFFVEERAATKGNWRSIVDMVHAGGFGINITGDTTGNTTDTVQMRIELGSGSGYVTHTDSALEVGVWHHVVVSYAGYDESNKGGEFTIYVDGEWAATYDAKGELRLPDFRNAESSYDYFCIGGCFTLAMGYDTWEGVTDCKVKVCNIFSDAVTATEVATMYSNAQN